MNERDEFEKWRDGFNVIEQTQINAWALYAWLAATARSAARIAELERALLECARKAEAEAARLREAIRNAPHSRTCKSRGCGKCHNGSAFSDHEGNCVYGTGPCNCWKRTALREG